MILEGKVKDVLRDVRRRLRKITRVPGIARTELGSLDRVTPISRKWGFDRGTPVDRLYIEDFIAKYQDDIRGRVLEVASNAYTIRFGHDRVSHSDILHDKPAHAEATLIFDLVKTAEAPAELFDCIICTQTLHLIYDKEAAIQSLHNMLKPGGVLLLTVPGISATPRRSMEGYTDYWRFTSSSVYRLFQSVFELSDMTVSAYGNVYAATAFLHGLAVEELDAVKLAYSDPDYEMLIAIRAMRSRPET